MSLTNEFRSAHREWRGEVVLALAIATAILFFASLLLHELSHSLVAKANGIPVKEITLFALGGVSQIEKESASAKTEFWMAVVGPITSAVIGTVCLAAAKLGSATGPLTTMLAWLGYINLGLAGFNLLPGFPLDGGRILRAIVWWKTGDVERSTHIAARAGQGVAVMFIMAGLADYLAGGGFNGLWITFVGWFLLQAASESEVQIGLRRSLEKVRVGDVMSRDCPVVDGHLNLQDFVEGELLRTGKRCFLVTENGKLAGLVTPHEIKKKEKRVWSLTTLDDVMVSVDQVRTIAPDRSLEDALELMSRENLNQLPVVQNGNLQGILSRADIVNCLQTRAELHV